MSSEEELENQNYRENQSSLTIQTARTATSSTDGSVDSFPYCGENSDTVIGQSQRSAEDSDNNNRSSSERVSSSSDSSLVNIQLFRHFSERTFIFVQNIEWIMTKENDIFYAETRTKAINTEKVHESIRRDEIAPRQHQFSDSTGTILAIGSRDCSKSKQWNAHIESGCRSITRK